MVCSSSLVHPRECDQMLTRDFLNSFLGTSGPDLDDSYIFFIPPALLACSIAVQATIAVLKEELEKQLALGFKAEFVAAFCSVWEEERAGLITRLKTQTLAPLSLESTPWQLHLHISQSNLAAVKEPSAIFQLSLNNRDQHIIGETKDKKEDPIQFEMDHHQLVSFYHDLERIQEQLDRLSSR